MKKIFAIIVTYNGMQWIEHCIESLLGSTVPVQILVIDNCSTDGTLDFINNSYPMAITFPQKRNLGFGQANNVGIRYALDNNADYCLLINQDAYLDKFALEKMLKVSDGNSLLSPIHLNGDGSRIDYMFKYSIRNSQNKLIDDLLINKELRNCYEMAEICAACWLMPIDLLKKIGGFNPLFFHYSEDSNYYQRMLFHNIKTLLVPSAYVRHDREVQGNIKVFNSKIIRRELLLNTCNINYSAFKILLKFFITLCKCYFVELPRKNYHIGTFLKDSLWLIGKSKKIRQSRIKEKQVGLTWL